MHTWFLWTLEVLAVLWLVTLVWGSVKRNLIHSVANVTKSTDDGESLSLSVNLMSYDDHGVKQEKLDSLWGYGDERKKFTFNRFQETLKEAQAEKESHLKKVK